MTLLSIRLSAFLLAGVILLGQGPTGGVSPIGDAGIPTAEYAGLTNPLSSATNFNIETVRGMLLTPSGLFAINTHGSTVVFHADLGAAPEGEWPTVNNPVAISSWNGRLLVVGGASWSLAEHDMTNGRILRHVQGQASGGRG